MKSFTFGVNVTSVSSDSYTFRAVYSWPTLSVSPWIHEYFHFVAVTIHFCASFEGAAPACHIWYREEYAWLCLSAPWAVVRGPEPWSPPLFGNVCVRSWHTFDKKVRSHMLPGSQVLSAALRSRTLRGDRHCPFLLYLRLTEPKASLDRFPRSPHAQWKKKTTEALSHVPSTLSYIPVLLWLIWPCPGFPLPPPP